MTVLIARSHIAVICENGEIPHSVASTLGSVGALQVRGSASDSATVDCAKMTRLPFAVRRFPCRLLPLPPPPPLFAVCPLPFAMLALVGLSVGLRLGAVAQALCGIVAPLIGPMIWYETYERLPATVTLTRSATGESAIQTPRVISCMDHHS
jgi:hypothetical protein